jgi:hypothetical protein
MNEYGKQQARARARGCRKVGRERREVRVEEVWGGFEGGKGRQLDGRQAGGGHGRADIKT